MSSSNPLSELTSLTEDYGGYDGDTVEELRETCRKLRQHAKELQATVDALTEGSKRIAQQPLADTETLRRVHMGLSEATMESVNELQAYLEKRTKADTVAFCIRLSESIVDVLRAGGKIVLTDEWGAGYELHVTDPKTEAECPVSKIPLP